MKNVLSVKLGEKTEKYDDNEFISRTIAETDSDLVHKQEELRTEAESVRKHFSVFQWIALIVYMIGALCLYALVRFLLLPLDEDPITYAEAFERTPWFVIGAAVGLVVCVIVFLLVRRHAKREQASPAMQYLEERAEKMLADSRAALGVPDTAEVCDVLVFPYSITRSGKVRHGSIMLGNVYGNKEFRLFREGDALCLADAETVIKIPFEKIHRLALVNKRIAMMGWNKPEAFNKGAYKQYKIRVNGNNGNMFYVKPYISMQLGGTEEYELLFPCYELDTVQRLTGRYPE